MNTVEFFPRERQNFKKNGWYKHMARVPFGGMKIAFSSAKDSTLGEVFGTTPIAPSEMTKKLWAFVKRKGLMKK